MKDNFKTILWIIGLAALSVGARNFELGLSLDAPLYATIARNIARSGEWIWMNTQVPDFVPFAEHPHGAFWIQALIFKLLPAADWAARIQGHLFYVLTLFLIYKVCVRHLNPRVATLSVLLLWIWPVYSNFYSNFYLDPSAIFFGFSFLYSLSISLRQHGNYPKGSRHLDDVLWAALSGICLALSFLCKGLTALAFGLPAAFLVIAFVIKNGVSRADLSGAWKHLLRSCGTSLIFLGLFAWVYLETLKAHQASDFLSIYWERQISNRFGPSWSFFSIFNSQFWMRLARDTHYFLFLIPLALWKSPNNSFVKWSFLSFISFVLMYAPAHRMGSQYWLLLMPPLSLILANALDFHLNISFQKIKNFSLVISLSLVFILQYLPFSTHTNRRPGEIDAILNLKSLGNTSNLMIAGRPKMLSFIYSAPFAWYADTELSYLDVKNLALGQSSLSKDTLSQTILLQHGRLPKQKSYPCKHSLMTTEQEIQIFVLTHDFKGTALYMPQDKAPHTLTRCLDSKASAH